MTAPTVLVHRYHPRGAAAALLERRDPEVLLSGPAGTGKSRACLEKGHLLASLNPESRGLMVRKTAVSLTSTGLVTYREHVAKKAIDSGVVRWYGGSQQEAPGYRYNNGSIVNVGGMDKPTKIMSSEYDWVYVQEAIELTEEDWEAITTRLRNGKISFQQLFADTNPSMPTHWLKQRVDRGDTVLLESRHRDNPVLYNDDGTRTPVGADYLDKLEKLTGVRRYRLRDGLWVAAEGLVYEEYDPDIHLIPKFRIPDHWVRWWVVDFGFTNPMVIQCWAEDPDGRLYLYRELYRTQRTVDQHAAKILSLVSDPDPANPKSLRARIWREPKPRAVICDHDAEGRAVFARETGLATRPAQKGVTDGIQATQKRLRDAGDGKPRLYFLSGATVDRDEALIEAKKPASTEEEIVGYVWEKGKDGKPNKEVPHKEDDHGMDCARYLVAHREGGRPGVRFLS
jgi:hypothetical protein